MNDHTMAQALEEYCPRVTSVLLGDETFGGAKRVRSYAVYRG